MKASLYRVCSVFLLFLCGAEGLHADECSLSADKAVRRREGLSNRSFVACCKNEEAAACLPALRARLSETLNTPANGRELFDLKYIVRAILRLGSSAEIEEVKRHYLDTSENPILTRLYAEGFIDYELASAVKTFQLSAEDIFPPQELAQIVIPDNLTGAPKDLLEGYREYRSIKLAEERATACDSAQSAKQSAALPAGFWASLAKYLLATGANSPAQTLDIESACQCARASEDFADTFLGLRLLELYRNQQHAAFVRAYALAWKANEFRWRRLCAFSDEEFFNEGVDALFKKANVDREQIYIGGMLAGDASLYYDALSKYAGKQTLARLELALPYLNVNKIKEIARAQAAKVKNDRVSAP